MYSGAKNLFDTFEKEADNVVKMLQERPSELVSVWGTPSMPIGFDSECLCGQTPESIFDQFKDSSHDSTSSRVATLLYRKQQCSKCIGLAHSAGKYNGEKVYELTVSCGPRSGESYVVHPTSNVSLSMEWYRPVDSEWLVSCDPWTNNLLINWYCSRLSSHILPIFGAYICGDTGHTIVSKSIDVRELKSISKKLHFGSLSYATASSYVPSLNLRTPKQEGVSVDTAMGLIHQLASVFSELSSVRFVHGDACSKNLVLLNKETTVKTDTKEFKYPLRLALRNFYYSSMTVGDNPRIRLSRDTMNNFFSTSKSISENLTRYRVSREVQGTMKDVEWLLFDNLSLRNYRDLHKHVSESATIDFVLFVFCLLANESFAYTMRASSLQEWFKGLWMPSEQTTVDEKIEMLHHDPSLAQDCSELLSLITGTKPLSIRADAIEYTMKFFDEKEQ
jgi:hypothetical protein